LARYLVSLAAHPASAAPGLPYALCVLLILGSHEMGHYLACRRYRVPCTLPFFIPVPLAFGTFGALIRIRGAIPDRRVLFDIGIAGPLAGFVPTVAVLAYGLTRARVLPGAEPDGGGALLFGDSLLTGLLIDWLVEGEGERIVVPSVFVAGWLGMLATALNLFPVGQLDGGHVTYALSRRFHRVVSRLTITAMLLLVGWSVIGALAREGPLPSLLLWTVVLVLMGSRHPPVRDESVPLGPGRWVLAFVGLLVFALCFMANPLRIAE
jgi:membrane-associated protease RseP (regulator of RpoE activity)